jgi:gliding motility-associated-like protein
MATGGTNGAGIGGGFSGAGGTITIIGGTFTATGAVFGAVIGGGYGGGYSGGDGGDGGTLTISGGSVTATGGERAAGIGGGYRGAGGSITNTGGTIKATGRNTADDIGKGGSGSAGTLTITGGSINATRGMATAPTNGDNNTPVYLNTLTVGSPAVPNAAISAGTISGVACATTPDAAGGVYGIHDVATDNDGKVYFWLTATADDKVVALEADGDEYGRKYTRDANNGNAKTLTKKFTVTLTADGYGLPPIAPLVQTDYDEVLTLPAPVLPACAGTEWVFAGWAPAAVATATPTAPAGLIPAGSYQPDGNVTLYAVYRKTETPYHLINTPSELEDGKRYLVASATAGTAAVMVSRGSSTSTDNQGQTVETADAGTITLGAASSATPFLLGGNAGTWIFSDGTYFLTATANTGGNYLRTIATPNAYSDFAISFSGNEADVVCTGKTTRNIMRYNRQYGLFNCYNAASGQYPIYLFKEQATSSTYHSSPELTGCLVVISGDNTICAGDSVQLSVPEESGATYQWRFDGQAIPSATATFYRAKTAGSYQVTVTADGYARASDAFEVSVNALPAAPSIVPVTSVCFGGTLTFAATPASYVQYEWERDPEPPSAPLSGTVGSPYGHRAAMTAAAAAVETGHAPSPAMNDNDRMHSYGMQGLPGVGFLPIDNPYGIASGYALPMTGADAAAMTAAAADAFRRNASIGSNVAPRTRYAFRRNATSHNDRMHSYGMQGLPGVGFLPIDNPYGIASGYALPMTGADAAAMTGAAAAVETGHAPSLQGISYPDATPGQEGALSEDVGSRLPTSSDAGIRRLRTQASDAFERRGPNPLGAGVQTPWAQASESLLTLPADSTAPSPHAAPHSPRMQRHTLPAGSAFFAQPNSLEATAKDGPVPMGGPLLVPMAGTVTANAAATHTAVGTYTYRVRGQDGNGCWSEYSSTATAEIYALPATPTIGAVTDVCYGNNLTFATATGFTQYEWVHETANPTPADTTLSTSASITQADVGSYTYKVRGKDGNDCWSDYSAAVTKEVYALPGTPSIGAVTDVCYGNDLTFATAPGFTGYEWVRVTANPTPADTITDAGASLTKTAVGTYTYKVRVKNSHNCWSEYSDTEDGEVFALPDTPTIATVTDVCDGNDLTFETAPGFTQYEWVRVTANPTPADTITDAGASLTRTDIGTYTYKVRVKNSNNCWSDYSAAKDGEVFELPTTPSIDAVTSVCDGNDLTFATATGYDDYEWVLATPADTTTGVGASLTRTDVGTYTYKVRVKNDNDCWSEYSAAVTKEVFELPGTPEIGAVTDVCDGNNLTFETETGYDGYEWVRVIANPTPADTITAAGASLTRTDVGTYTYKVRVKNDNDCWSDYSAAKDGEVFELPTTPSIDAVTDVCDGNNLTFATAPGFTQYEWVRVTANPTSADTITDAGASLTRTDVGTYTYKVRVKNSNNCWSDYSDTEDGEVFELPTTPTIGAVTDVCFGNDLTFATAPGFTGYEWVHETANPTPADTITDAGASITQTDVGTYTYKVRVKNSNHCWSDYSAAVTKEVFELPATPLIDAVTSVCDGNDLTFETATGFTGYEWVRVTANPTAADTITNAGASLTRTDIGTYTYKVRVKNDNDCWSDYSAAVTKEVFELPATPTIAPVTDVCYGNNLTFATDAVYEDYEWVRATPADTTTGTYTITHIAVGTYTYKVRGQDGNSCWSDYSAAVTKEVFELPTTPSIDAVTDVCDGNNLTFATASGFTQYEWVLATPADTTLNGSNTITQTAVGTYTYKVRGQDGNGCWSDYSAAVTAEVFALPATPSIVPVTSVCDGSNLLFNTATGYSVYEWVSLPALDTTRTTVGFLIETAVGSYSYKLRVKDIHGCWSADYSAAASGEVYALPHIGLAGASGDAAVCPGTPLQPPLSYTLSGSATGFTVNGLPAGVTATLTDGAITIGGVPSLPGIYNYVIRTVNPYGCGNEEQRGRITVLAAAYPPVLNHSGSLDFCDGGSVMLIASGVDVATYHWTKDGAALPVTGGLYTTGEGGVYAVSVTNSNGCVSSPSSITVTVHTVPSAPALTAGGAPTAFCEGGRVVISVETPASGDSYRWYRDGVLLPSVSGGSYEAAVAGRYHTVAVSDAGCLSSQSNAIGVTVRPAPAMPVVTVVSGAIASCEGATLQAVAQGAASYQWYRNGASIDTPDASGATLPVRTSGEYHVVVASTEGCEAPPSAAVSITVYPVPTGASLTSDEPLSFCAGGSVLLTASAVDGNDYRWYHNGALVNVGSNVYTAALSGEYWVVAVGLGGCLSEPSAALSVTVQEAPSTPVLSLTDDGVLCEGETTTLRVSAPGAIAYRWYRNGGLLREGIATTLEVAQSGLYSVVALSDAGCPSIRSSEQEITAVPRPAQPVIAGEALVRRMRGASVEFRVANETDDVTYRWYKNGVATANGFGAAFFLASVQMLDEAVYAVRATTRQGGCFLDSKPVTLDVLNEIKVANIVTPNGDDRNEFLSIEGLDTYASYEIRIVNRYGNEVFRTSAYTNDEGRGWRGDNLPDGVYFYSIRLVEANGETVLKTGYITLKR